MEGGSNRCPGGSSCCKSLVFVDIETSDFKDARLFSSVIMVVGALYLIYPVMATFRHTYWTGTEEGSSNVEQVASLIGSNSLKFQERQ